MHTGSISKEAGTRYTTLEIAHKRSHPLGSRRKPARSRRLFQTAIPPTGEL